MIHQGEIWWADLPAPIGSETGHTRPVIVLQRDALNRTALGTVIVVPLTSNAKWAAALGNVSLPADVTGLRKDSVAIAALIAAIDRRLLRERVGRLGTAEVARLIAGVNLVLGA